MKCVCCGEDIKITEDYDLYGMDGDMIHIKCKEKMELINTKIANMTDDEFENYMLSGKID